MPSNDETVAADDPTTIRERHPDAFPTLTEEQVDRLTRERVCRTYADGEPLFTAGDPEFCFHYIHEGFVEIYGNVGRETKPYLTHVAGDFTGDLEDLSGRGASVTGIAKGCARVCEMSLEDLRTVLNTDIELSDIIMRAFMARGKMLEGSEQAAVNVWGRGTDKEAFRIRDFLTKNRVIHNWYDVDGDAGARWASVKDEYALTEDVLPFIAQWRAGLPGEDGRSELAWRLDRPTNRELAEKLRLNRPIREDKYDLVIVGAGPAGLAAAVYGASEGLCTLVVDCTAPGGQAGNSMRIENYLGFPMGLTGKDLATNASIQAQKFGATLASPVNAIGLEIEDGRPVLKLDGGEAVRPKTLIIATGAEYTKLDVPELDRYEGAGVFYAATPLEAQTCKNQEVVIVGGGNSAGQACVFLAGLAKKVHLLIRGQDLRKSMSEYLVKRIEGIENVQLWTSTEVCALHGEKGLDRLEIRNRETGERGEIVTNSLFLFIGATPNTHWLPESIRCEKGFVLTGKRPEDWPLDRAPLWLETSVPGIFAAGDVRAGSVKRVASAVGEGAMAVQFVHQALADIAGVPR